MMPSNKEHQRIFKNVFGLRKGGIPGGTYQSSEY